jgi:hypothetical protein
MSINLYFIKGEPMRINYTNSAGSTPTENVLRMSQNRDVHGGGGDDVPHLNSSKYHIYYTML